MERRVALTEVHNWIAGLDRFDGEEVRVVAKPEEGAEWPELVNPRIAEAVLQAAVDGLLAHIKAVDQLFHEMFDCQ